MALRLTAHIRIGALELQYAHEVRIESSFEHISDRCEIVLPDKVLLKRSNMFETLSLERVLQSGMPVSVSLGYDDNNHLLFEGYVAKIKPDVPLKILCEDEAYKLKRSQKISRSFSGQLSALIDEYFAEVEIDKRLPDVRLSNFIMKDVTPAEVLQKLKEHYGLVAYFRGKRLYVGLPYFENPRPRHKLDFQKNIIAGSLEYRKKEDISLKVKAVSILKDNSKIEVETGDSNGEQRTLYFYDIESKSELLKIAESELLRLKFDGYRGKITLFGVPVVQHSDTVLLYDKRYEERSGQAYLVKSVKTTWGVNGYRQEVELDRRVL